MVCWRRSTALAHGQASCSRQGDTRRRASADMHRLAYVSRTVWLQAARQPGHRPPSPPPPLLGRPDPRPRCLAVCSDDLNGGCLWGNGTSRPRVQGSRCQRAQATGCASATADLVTSAAHEEVPGPEASLAAGSTTRARGKRVVCALGGRNGSLPQARGRQGRHGMPAWALDVDGQVPAADERRDVLQ